MARFNVEEVRITDIPGFRVGQTEDLDAATGCTVVIREDGGVCGVDVRGGSPGTRDTDALNPVNNREKVHAVLLAGGSSFGLDAAGGVMRYLEEHRVGRDVGVTVVPNVCAAILFDLKCGRPDVRPDEQMGYAACANAWAGQAWASGNRGAGAGATVGTILGTERAMKGGIGSVAYRLGDLYVGAIVVVNCVGDIYDHARGRQIAGARTADGKGFADSEKAILDMYGGQTDLFSGNTVLGCVMTNARLTKAQAAKLATLGQNGIARAIRPAHTIFDGDTIFTLCGGDTEATLDAVGILASRAVEQAIVDGILHADTIPPYISAKDMGPALRAT